MMAFSHRVVQKQMAFMLGRHGVFLELSEDVEEYEDLTEIMSNVQLNSNFLALAREVRLCPIPPRLFGCDSMWHLTSLTVTLTRLPLVRTTNQWDSRRHS